MRSAPMLRHIPPAVSTRLAWRPSTRIREPGPSAMAGGCARVPGDEDAARLELLDREAARRRVPLGRTRILNGLRAEVDHRAEVQLAGPAERICLPRSRVAEAEEGVRVRDELRVRLRRRLRVGPATAAARHCDEGHERCGAHEEAPRSQAGFHTSFCSSRYEVPTGPKDQALPPHRLAALVAGSHRIAFATSDIARMRIVTTTKISASWPTRATSSAPRDGASGSATAGAGASTARRRGVGQTGASEAGESLGA